MTKISPVLQGAKLQSPLDSSGLRNVLLKEKCPRADSESNHSSPNKHAVLTILASEYYRVYILMIIQFGLHEDKPSLQHHEQKCQPAHVLSDRSCLLSPAILKYF